MNYLASMQSSKALLTTSLNSINQQSYSTSCSISVSEESTSDCYGFDMLLMAQQMTNIDEQILLKSHGYIKEEQINTTTQGEVFLARKGDEFVAIKKIAKDCCERKECIQNECTFITDKNIVKERLILQSITENKELKNNFIIKFIDAFDSEDHYYLVEEYIEASKTLKDFVIKAHQYIKQRQLKIKSYKKCITKILYQLAIVLHSLHNTHKCVHLDIVPENILLKQADFFQNADETVAINPNIELRLKDFGLAEKFEADNDTFECNKQFLTIDNEQYLCPDIKDNIPYHGRGIDMWAFGMTMYYCYAGSYPYKTMEFTNDLVPMPVKGSGYWAVLNGKIHQQLAMNSKLNFINGNILSLLNKLININSDKRINSVNVLKHRLFAKFCEINCTK